MLLLWHGSEEYCYFLAYLRRVLLLLWPCLEERFCFFGLVEELDCFFGLVKKSVAASLVLQRSVWLLLRRSGESVARTPGPNDVAWKWRSQWHLIGNLCALLV